MRHLTILSLLASTALLGGCPKKTKPITLDETQAQDPVAVFEAGKAALTPDRKGNIDYPTAYEFFRKAADDLNGGPKAEFNAGWVAERVGNTEAAEGHYRDAFNADPDYEAARYSYVRLLRARDNHQAVAEVFAKYLEKHNTDEAAKTEYMQSLVDASRYDEAVTIGQEVLRKNPKSVGVYRALSSLYLSQGKLEMAQILGDKAIEISDTDPDVHNNLGVVALQEKDLPTAVERFKRAREIDEGHFEANMNLGLIAADSGDYTLAKDCFEKAKARNPSSVDAQIGYAVAIRGLGDLDGAEKIYDDLIKKNPKLQIAYLNQAAIAETFRRDFTKAQKVLEGYKTAMGSSLAADDVVHKRIEEVLAAKAADEKRKAEEAARKKAEEERVARAKKLLEDMVASVASMKKKVADNATCLPEDTAAELGMFVEEADSIIASQDTEMAADLKQLLDDYYAPMLDEALVANGCTGAPPAEAPPADAPPAEGTAPAEGTPPTEPAPATP